MANIFIRLGIIILSLIILIILICYFSSRDTFLTNSGKKMITNLI